MRRERIQELVKEGKYFYYTHALTEAKKDGVEPEDVITVILHGEVIEEYVDRKGIARIIGSSRINSAVVTKNLLKQVATHCPNLFYRVFRLPDTDFN